MSGLPPFAYPLLRHVDPWFFFGGEGGAFCSEFLACFRGFPFFPKEVDQKEHRDVGKGGLSLRGVAFMTGFDGFGGSGKHLALLSFRAVLQNKQKEATVMVWTVSAGSVVTATPLKLNPPFRHPENKNPCFSGHFPCLSPKSKEKKIRVPSSTKTLHT